MKKQIPIILTFLCLWFVLNLPTALAKSPTKKADQLIQNASGLMEIDLAKQAVAKLSEAETILLKILSANHKDYNALFLYGKCRYLKNTKDSKVEAYKKFVIANRKSNGAFGQKIFEFYHAEGEKLRKQNQLTRAFNTIALAYRFNPNPMERLNAAQDFCQSAERFIYAGNIRLAKVCYQNAINLNPESRTNCLDRLRLAIDTVKARYKIVIVVATFTYFDKNEQKQLATKVGHSLKDGRIKQSQINQQLKRLPRHMRIIIISIAYPPDYIICKRGDKPTYKLRAGKYSPWHRAYGTGLYQEFQSQYGEYEVCFRGDKCYPKGNAPEYSLADFRFHAITNSDVRAVFK